MEEPKEPVGDRGPANRSESAKIEELSLEKEAIIVAFGQSITLLPLDDCLERRLNECRQGWLKQVLVAIANGP